MPDVAATYPPGPEPELTGRDRLFAALKRPASRSQLTAAFLLGVLGFAAVVQVRANNEDDRYAGASQQDLIQLINSQELATGRVEEQIRDLQSSRDALEVDSQAAEVARDLARKQAISLGILAGTLPAVGPGVEVRVDGPPESIGAEDLVNGIQELRDAGAEAMQLNDTVRLVGSSSISDGPGDSIIVDGQPLEPPFVIDAIGSPTALDKAVFFRQGFAEGVRENGGDVTVRQLDQLEISTTREAKAPRYAEPTD